jgi:alpha-N-arabinofuranosidase
LLITSRGNAFFCTIFEDASRYIIQSENKSFNDSTNFFRLNGRSSASASIDANGKLHITLSNANPHKDLPVMLYVRGMEGSQVQGRVLQGSRMNAHNTFEKPNEVQPTGFNNAKLNADGLDVTMPKMTVVALEVS